MSEPVVRISQGFFEPRLTGSVTHALQQGRTTLDRPCGDCADFCTTYVSIDAMSSSMVNVSVWETMAVAKQMESLQEMLAQRDTFVSIGVRFQPIRTYTSLWPILA